MLDLVTIASFSVLWTIFIWGFLMGIESCAKHVQKKFGLGILLAAFLGIGLSGAILSMLLISWFITNIL